MASEFKIEINERIWTISAAADTPLLYVLSNELPLDGPRFGCGLAHGGSCSVLVDGRETRFCVTPVGSLIGKSVTTLEGLPTFWARSAAPTQIPRGFRFSPIQRSRLCRNRPQLKRQRNGSSLEANRREE